MTMLIVKSNLHDNVNEINNNQTILIMQNLIFLDSMINDLK